MPHLMFEWLLARSRRERWPTSDGGDRARSTAPGRPWQRAAPTGTQYVSFAEWICPVNCIEPATCPKTREARVVDHAGGRRVVRRIGERAAGRPIAGSGYLSLYAPRVRRRDVRHAAAVRGMRSFERREPRGRLTC